MATFTNSEYGKFAQLQNNSGSAAADAPDGGIYLFASGAVGSSKLYMQKEGSTEKYEVGSADLKIAADSGTDSTVGIGLGETLTIAGGTGLDTSVSGQTITFSMDLGELDEEALAVADDYIVFLDGGATGASKKEKLADVVTNIAGAGIGAVDGVLSASVDNSSIEVNSDALRVKALGVTNAMLAGSITDSKLNAISSANKVEASALELSSNTAMEDDAGLALKANIAGDGLAIAESGGNQILSVGVDGVGIEINSDALRLKDDGVVTAKIADSNVTNAKLANDSVTIGSTEIDLGATAASLAGITNLTASNIQVTNLDVVNVNSVSQTESTLEVIDKLIVASVSASSANSAGGGLRIGGGQDAAGHAAILWDHANTALDFNIGSETQLRLVNGSLLPNANADINLGSDALEFGDIYIDGTAYLDAVDIDGGAIDGATVGATSQAAGKFTTLSGSGAATLASTLTVQGNVLPFLDDNADLGSSSKQWKDLYVDGIAYIDQIGTDADPSAAYISSGEIDGTVIGGESAAAATFTTATVNTSLLPDAAGGADIGSTGAEFGDVYIADDKKIQFGNDQDATIEYDADGTSELRFAGAAVTFEQAVSFDANVTLGLDVSDVVNVASNFTASMGLKVAGFQPSIVIGDGGAEDTKLVFDGNAQDFYMGLDDTDDKLKIGLGSAVGTTPNLILESATQNVGVQGGLQVVGDAIADSGFTGANPVMTFDGSQGVLFAGNTTTSGTSLFRGNVTFSGSSNVAPDVTFKQDGNLNGFLRWDSSENNLYLQYGSDAGNGVQVLTLGGSGTSDYALDVVNGSNNINKVRAAAFVTYSDESLKSDVETMNTALDTVMSLNGVEFTWKDSGERDFGFIAQDVQSVLPKAVHTADDGVQGVDYSRLTSVLVEAVKAQQVQIEDLKKTLAKLKK